MRPDDHAELLSEPDAHDLPFALDPVATGERHTFGADPYTERSVVAAYRVSSGTVELQDVTGAFR